MEIFIPAAPHEARILLVGIARTTNTGSTYAL